MPTWSRAQEMVGAGQGGHGWVVLRASIGRQTSWTLYHLPRDSDPATIARVRTLSAIPAHMGASHGRLIMVFEEQRDGGETSRSVRQLRVREGDGTRARYEPASRLNALPSLPSWGEIRGIVALADGAVALVVDPIQGRCELLRLATTSWDPIELPDNFSSVGAWGVAPIEDSFALIGNESTGGLQRVWRFQSHTDDDSSSWSEPQPIEVGVRDSVVSGASSSLVVLQRQSDGGLIPSVHTSTQHHLAPLEGVGRGYVAMNVNDQLVLLWQTVDQPAPGSSKEGATRLRARVLTVSGEVLYDEYARPMALLTDNDLQKLTLLFGAVLVMILLFVLRPDPVALGALRIPEGHVVASPMRRIIAALVDLLPIVAIVAWYFGVPLGVSLGLDLENSSQGLWPVMISASGACAMQTTTEWLFGFTPGKLLVGCRTRHADGGRISARQALVRNLVKYACPPLAALMLLDPTKRHPGDYLAGSVVVMSSRLAPEDSQPPVEEDGDDQESS